MPPQPGHETRRRKLSAPRSGIDAPRFSPCALHAVHLHPAARRALDGRRLGAACPRSRSFVEPAMHVVSYWRDLRQDDVMLASFRRSGNTWCHSHRERALRARRSARSDVLQHPRVRPGDRREVRLAEPLEGFPRSRRRTMVSPAGSRALRHAPPRGRDAVVLRVPSRLGHTDVDTTWRALAPELWRRRLCVYSVGPACTRAGRWSASRMCRLNPPTSWRTCFASSAVRCRQPFRGSRRSLREGRDAEFEGGVAAPGSCWTTLASSSSSAPRRLLLRVRLEPACSADREFSSALDYSMPAFDDRLRHQRQVRSMPSRSPVFAHQPCACIRDTSSSFRGVPSGFVVSLTISPL